MASGQRNQRKTPNRAGTEPKVDGRAARSERTREAIADAMLALIAEGDLQPTAARIAKRAGISERLIYHHFDDLEALLGAVADRQIERVMDRIAPIDPSASFDERLDAIVEQRASILEWITPVRRAAILQEPFSPQLCEHRDRINDHARRELARVFAPELERMPAAARREVLGALGGVTSWGCWDAMRTAGLSAAAAQRSMRRTLAALLTPAHAD